jgi:hypothetical protein
MGVIIVDGWVVDGTHGGRRGIWREFSALVGRFIEKEKLVPIRLRLMADKTSIKLPQRFPGIPEPHLHYQGKMYAMTQANWQQFSNMVVEDLKVQIGKIKTVNLDGLSAMSAVINIEQTPKRAR